MEHDDLTDDLAAFLGSVDREDAYRVERVLKTSDAERTELVYFAAGGGAELGPFIRKRIDLAAGGGAAYEVIWHAQQQGARFAHLPRIIECRRAGDELTVVMEYVEGETLETLVAREGASAELAQRVIPAVCDAVAELHDLASPPLIHRDIKPSNIIMSGAVPVIIDFGIARVYREGGGADTVRFGTRGYAAPEQYGFGQTSVRSDVYALGMLLFFCCTGAQPSGALDAVLLERAGIPVHLAQVMLKAAAFDPVARYTSARELGEAVRRASEENAGVVLAHRSHALVAQREDTPIASHTGGQTINRSSAPVPKTENPRRAGAHLAAKFARIPAWVGILWNACILGAFILTVMGSVFAVFEPTGENINYPTWFLALEYFFMLVPSAGAIMYLLLDRRRLRQRIPLLRDVTWRQELRICITIMAATVTVTVIVAQFVM